MIEANDVTGNSGTTHCSTVFSEWNEQEVVRVVRWFLSRSAKRKRLAMAVGGFQEVLQETIVALLKYPPSPSVKMTTAVCNVTRWTLCAMYRKRNMESTYGVFCDAIGCEADTGADVREWRCRIWKIVVESLPHDLSCIVWRRMNGETLEEVARRYNRSREVIRQRESKGIRRLQHHSVAEQLLPLMDQ